MYMYHPDFLNVNIFYIAYSPFIPKVHIPCIFCPLCTFCFLIGKIFFYLWPSSITLCECTTFSFPFLIYIY